MKAAKIFVVLVLVVSIVAICHVRGQENDGIDTKEIQRSAKSDLLAIQTDVKNLKKYAKAVEFKVSTKARERPGLSSTLRGVLGLLGVVPNLLEGILISLEGSLRDSSQ